MKTVFLKGRLCSLMMICSLVFPIHAYAAAIYDYGIQYEENTQEPSDLYAKSAVLLDGESGRVLFEKNGYEQLPMASTTKIMTCIVALENGNPEDIVTVGSNAAKQPKVHLGMQTGEKFYLKDLLYSLMLESHNDSAVAIAEHIAGSVEAFADLMNQKARDIGCLDTWFITPNGLDAQETFHQGEEIETTKIHSTTAADLAKIMKYCIRDSQKAEQFLSITREKSYSFTDAEGRRSFSCNNHNAFLQMMDGALSGKTGFTGKAGYCYVGALKQGDRTFIVALLACGWPNNKSYKWSDTKKLMNYGLSNYEYRDVFEEIPGFEAIPVRNGCYENGKNPKLQVYIESEPLLLLLKASEDVQIEYHVPEILEAPIAKGDVVGSVDYYLNEQLVKRYYLYAKSDIDRIDYRWCLQKVIKVFIDKEIFVK